MVVRTNSKTGEQFWGCCNFGSTGCNGSRPTGNEDASLRFGRPFWYDWTAPAGFADGVRTFLPAAASLDPPNGDADRPVCWNHLCIIEPDNRHKPDVTPSQQAVIHVAWRLLARGHAPPVSRRLRSILVDSAEIPLRSTAAAWSSEHGSEEEGKFFHEIAPELLGPKLLPYLHVQVPLPALAKEANDGQVDFALIYPAADGRAVVIEIDGEQHANDAAKLADKRRDDLLRRAGHTVVRIPVRAVREGNPSGFSELRAAIAAARNGESEIRRLDTRAAAAAHTQAALLHLVATGRLQAASPSWTVGLAGEATDAMQAGIECFEPTLGALCDLYETPGDPRAEVARIWPDEVRLRRIEASTYDPAGSEPVDVVLHWAKAPWFAERSCAGVLRDKMFALRPCWLPVLTTIPGRPEWADPNPHVDDESLKHLLGIAFPDKDAFWEGQETGLRRTLNGDDSLILLPTGGGKSLIYQLAALLTPGLTLVVSPLVALMEDQKDNLRRAGVDRVVAISSQLPNEMRRALQNLLDKGVLTMCYVAPERLQIKAFRETLIAVLERFPIPAVVVDEAHCVSEWGHDFRPAYLNLARIAKLFGRRGKGKPPAVNGLTGTASRGVLRDVSIALNGPGPESVLTPERMDRDELTIEIRSVASASKAQALKEVLDEMPSALGLDPGAFRSRGRGTACGIVFCPHIGGDFGVNAVAQTLQAQGFPEARIFHGQLEDAEKATIARDFKNNAFNLLVATKAFGMGIDKPNVRFTVHYCMPSSLEMFYQEAGRAGRDGQPARCVILASVDYPEQARGLLSGPASELAREFASIPKNKKDDVTRALYFLSEAFPGPEADLGNVEVVLSSFRDVDLAKNERIEYGGGSELTQRIAERALHRLVLLGIVRDYTVDYNGQGIEVDRDAIDTARAVDACVDYVRKYNRERARVLAEALRERALHGDAVLRGKREEPLRGAIVVCEDLLHFIYDTICAARREAVKIVWNWVLADDSNRRQILQAYLDTTSTAASQVVSFTESETWDLVRWQELIDGQPFVGPSTDGRDGVTSAHDLRRLKGAIDREIENQPDWPPLFAMRAVLASMSAEASSEDAMIDAARRCMECLRDPYAKDQDALAQHAVWIVRNALERGQQALDRLVEALTHHRVDTDGSISVQLKPLRLPPAVRRPISRRLLQLLNEDLEDLVKRGFRQRRD